MKISIKELQELISKQKQLAGINFFGAFRDGFIAALDIVNAYINMKIPKCSDCQNELLEEEIDEGNGVCEKCYQRAQSEAQAERKREESGT